MVFDIKPNEIRYRIQEPKFFEPKSFRRKQIKEGISLVLGCPKGKYKKNKSKCSVGMETQSLRFDRELFTPSKAKNWLKRHSLM